MRRPLVAGNWKMNGSAASVTALMKGLRDGVEALAGVDVLVCPPHVYAGAVVAQAGAQIQVGAQDASEYAAGAYTGETAVAMLKDVGCSHVIVGHSERRALFGDTDARVAAKFAAVREAGMVPILCVGETLAQREAGETLQVVGSQVGAVLGQQGAAAFDGAVVAYEPVWAIGTGLTATPEQAQEVHAALRAQIAEADEVVAAKLPILYGGSVNAGNADALFAQADIDGGLVGGASLKVDEFLAICRAAS